MPAKRGARGGGPDDAAGRGPGDAAAVLQVLVQGGDGVGGRAGGLQVDEVVDAVAAAGWRSPSVAQSNAVRMCPYWMARATRPLGRRAICQARLLRKRARPIGPVRVGGDGLAGQAVPGCLAVRPVREILDPLPERGGLQGAGVGPLAAHVVGVVVEQQVPVGHHALQDADGVDDRRDGHPGNLALGAAGTVVAVLVGGGLELQAADQVPPRLPVRARDGVGAASGAQPQDLSGAHARQVRADDECGRAQVTHQELGPR